MTIYKTPLIVVDTNVVVSGLLKPYSASGGMLRLVIAGTAKLLYDARILIEYQEVLSRAKFGFNKSYIDNLLDYFRLEGIPVAAQPLNFSLPDPDDAPFLEVALSGGADALITGNKAHFPENCPGAEKVLGPSEFITRFFPSHFV